MAEAEAVLVMETTALTVAVATGANVTSKDVVADGCTVAGSDGKLARLKNLPLRLIALTVTGFKPVFVRVIVFVEVVLIVMLPKGSGFGVGVRLESGSAVAVKVTGLPVNPAAPAVTVFVPTAGPSVRTAEAWP